MKPTTHSSKSFWVQQSHRKLSNQAIEKPIKHFESALYNFSYLSALHQERSKMIRCKREKTLRENVARYGWATKKSPQEWDFGKQAKTQKEIRQKENIIKFNKSGVQSPTFTANLPNDRKEQFREKKGLVRPLN